MVDARGKKPWLKHMLQTRAFEPSRLSGAELPWEAYAEYQVHKKGSNCYSFALNDFRRDGERAHKSVPGQLAMAARRRWGFARLARYRFDVFEHPTGWSTCGETVQRVLADGVASAEIQKLRQPGLALRTAVKLAPLAPASGLLAQARDRRGKAVDAMVQADVQRALHARPAPGWRKVFLVCQSRPAASNASTDFHWYAQYALPVDRLYAVPLAPAPRDRAFVDVYATSGVPVFATAREVARRHRDVPEVSVAAVCPYNRRAGLTDPRCNRALTNLLVHLRRVPRYALGYIPDAHWLLDVPRDLRPVATRVLAEERARTLKALRLSGDADAVVDAALRRVVSGRSRRARGVLGLWAHKAGWATGPMNADATGRLVFDPNLCDRDHGAFAYDSPCAVFMVARGRAMTSMDAETA
jgi:hypothetical protein